MWSESKGIAQDTEEENQSFEVARTLRRADSHVSNRPLPDAMPACIPDMCVLLVHRPSDFDAVATRGGNQLGDSGCVIRWPWPQPLLWASVAHHGHQQKRREALINLTAKKEKCQENAKATLARFQPLRR